MNTFNKLGIIGLLTALSISGVTRAENFFEPFTGSHIVINPEDSGSHSEQVTEEQAHTSFSPSYIRKHGAPIIAGSIALSATGAYKVAVASKSGLGLLDLPQDLAAKLAETSQKVKQAEADHNFWFNEAITQEIKENRMHSLREQRERIVRALDSNRIAPGFEQKLRANLESTEKEIVKLEVQNTYLAEDISRSRIAAAKNLSHATFRLERAEAAATDFLKNHDTTFARLFGVSSSENRLARLRVTGLSSGLIILGVVGVSAEALDFYQAK